MENRPEERDELLERGPYALEHPGGVEPRGDPPRSRLLLRLWRYAPFEPWVAWALFEPGR
jgi:hypothetical protein